MAAKSISAGIGGEWGSSRIARGGSPRLRKGGGVMTGGRGDGVADGRMWRSLLSW